MAVSLFKKLIGDDNSRELRRLSRIVESVNKLEPFYRALLNDELKGKTSEFQRRLAENSKLDEILPEAFALVREAARRTLGERHFDVQLMGGVVLHEGGIAEMRTGEGKTLVATLPVYLNALTGAGAHVVTVNDYLARRDTVWMGQIYDCLGLSVAVITHDESFLYDPSHTEGDRERDERGSFHVVHEFLRPVSRQEAYAADITYGTNSEFGFDYLRDNIEYEKSQIRQRSHTFAIVDEIDSILIDEARTPLIISAPAEDSGSLYRTFAGIARQLEQDKDYTVDEKLHAITITEQGINKAERLLGVGNIYTDRGIRYVHHLEAAVKAKALFQRDKEYVVRDGEVIIVDEFTGRLQPGRRWSEGLHQAIEAKEGVEIQKESRTYASITYQNYFRMYQKLSGMTGTAATSAEEFYKVYGLRTVVIPTNKPSTRLDGNDLIFQTESGKFQAVIRKIQELNTRGQPVLVGTVSIEKNELLSSLLSREGVKHEMLNAKNHEREGEIIAQAGRRGAVTIATNMAGRGVDIKLGGNPASREEYEEVRSLGGLFVLGTERHEARRIDNQLRGRSGRQGDPGGTQFFVSLGDTLMRVFASDTIKKMMGRFGIPEDQPIENRLVTNALEKAQEKIEGFHFDARKHVLEFDDVLNFQRKVLYERRRKMLVGSDEEVEQFVSELFAGESEENQTALTRKREELGREQFLAMERAVVLQTIDMYWIEHLEVMDYMRGSVNLRAYGQRDPLVEYKREGLRLFKEMEAAVEEQIVRLLPHLGGAVRQEEKNLQEVQEGASGLTAQRAAAAELKRVGRNDPCPCGAVNPATGKVYKYKHCGLINAPYHKA
ncbi:preprotein translocase subunit SecA [Patescibacteria group bacterium]|nr:MAG: preprotein translocase subunit SecA [Patescibacteria group bacterium]